jgi:hypothetical protein
MPSTAYFAMMSATRAKSGIAGYGRPLKSIRFMAAERSVPRSDRTECPASAPGLTLCSVMSPSISTVSTPRKLTTMTTRTIGGIAPPAMRNNVWSGDRLLSVNLSSKALSSSPDADTTCTSVSAESTG